MLVRLAELRDLPELLDIYNYEVLNGYATFDSVPHTYEQRKVWFDEHNKDHHPLIVAVDDKGKDCRLFVALRLSPEGFV